jgi:hypothetical protein
MPNRENLKRLTQEVREVLLDKWDPLCVGDNPNLADEYDAYLPPLVRLLAGAPVDKASLIDYLTRVERDEMGFPGDPAKLSAEADALMALAKGER